MILQMRTGLIKNFKLVCQSSSSSFLLQIAGHLKTTNLNKNRIYEQISMKLNMHKILTNLIISNKNRRSTLIGILIGHEGHLKISSSTNLDDQHFVPSCF